MLSNNYVLITIVWFSVFNTIGAHQKVNLDVSVYGGTTLDQKNKVAAYCMSKVKEKVLPAIMDNQDVLAGNCLRYAFHDCGTFDSTSGAGRGGCNGGIRSTIAYAISQGKYTTEPGLFPEDHGMLPCQTLLVGVDGKSGACGAVRLENPDTCGKMPFADCINFAGYLAVVATEGAPPEGCPWIPGRVDVPDNFLQQTTLLPPETANADGLLAVFNKYAMPYLSTAWDLTRQVVVLSGAHTIGYSRIHDVSPCSKGIDELSKTDTVFDVEYYQGIVNTAGRVSDRGGWFCSDMHGYCDNIVYNDPTSLERGYCPVDGTSKFQKLYKQYAAGTDTDFRKDFCKAYQIMSLIGYNAPVQSLFTTTGATFQALLKPIVSAVITQPKSLTQVLGSTLTGIVGALF